MFLPSIILQIEELVGREEVIFSHMLARMGFSDGLRVLGLMDRLSSAQDGAGMDLLSWAARGGDEACLLLAGEVCGAGQCDVWGGWALHHWAESKGGRTGAGGQILLTLGSDPAARDKWGLLPIHWSQEPDFWAWSMAALWSRGQPNEWMECLGVGYQEVSRRLDNDGFVDWVRKSKSSRRVTMEPGAQPKPSGGSEQGLGGGEWLARMFERRIVLGQMEAAQNCIAKKLGIELSDHAKR